MKEPLEVTEFKNLLAAAKKGDADAQYHLAGHFKYGLGTTKNHKEKFKWCKLAAEQGHMLAQHNLATYYDDGCDGVKQNKQEAVKWYLLAAKQGYGQSQHNLSLCYSSGEGVKQDLAESIKWLKLAVDQGLAVSQYNYAVALFKGEDIAQDVEESKKWFILAAQQGHPMAMHTCENWGDFELSEKAQMEKKEIMLNQRTVIFFNGFVPEQKWKHYPQNQLAGKYIGHDVRFFTMPADKSGPATAFAQKLKEEGFDAALKKAKDKPSIVVDLTASVLRK